MTARDLDRTCIAIRNPRAGRKAGVPTSGKPTAELREILGRHGLQPRIIETASEQEAAEAARAAVAEGVQTVIAIGGDGTTSLIGRELAGSETALAILPLGSFMNLARSLGIPHDLEEAAAIIAAGYRRKVDLGEVQGRFFFESLSVGLSAELFRDASAFDKGHYRSIFGVVWTLLRYRPARFSIHLDDRVVRTRALMAVVANGPYTGANLTFAPDARLDDGLFDVRVYRRFSHWETIRHLASIMLGRRGYSFKIATYRSAHVRVETASPRPCRADDFDLGLTPIECSVRRAALTVVAPQSHRSPALSS